MEKGNEGGEEVQEDENELNSLSSLSGQKHAAAHMNAHTPFYCASCLTLRLSSARPPSFTFCFCNTQVLL